LSKLGLVALAAIMALAMGLGLRGATQTAHAEVDESVAVWCVFLAGGIDGDPDDDAVAQDYTDACNGITAADIVNLANALGDEDAALEASDLGDLDLDANQVTDVNAAGTVPSDPVGTAAFVDLDEIYIFAFVDDDGPVTFDRDAGVTVHVNDEAGGYSANTDANDEVCIAEDDLDCDDSTPGTDDGDGVVVATIVDATADAGDDILVNVEQESAGTTETIAIVGAADELSFIAYEQAIETSGSSTDVTDCVDDSDASDADQLGDVNRTFVAATVVDDDGVELTRILVDIFEDDDDIAQVGDSTGVTVDAGDIGTAAFAVVCGGDTTGTAIITAEAGGEDADVEIAVVGAPAAIVLTAAPPSIICNGTNSSTVTATVTDDEGNTVAGGTNVNFSVVALGTANPINFGTVEGVASSQITPLAGTIAGVTVVVTAGDAEASILINCNTPDAPGTPIAPAPTATPGGGITGPDTGNGGYLGQDSSSGVSAWMLIALALGAVALVGGGVLARRAAK
jgi:hypothetical protein